MKGARPPRRASLGPVHDWLSQAPQYYRSDVPRTPGIVHWTVPASETPVRIECLLFWGADDRLMGILNYYPDGSPFGEQPHDTLTLVNPQYRRIGIGTTLLATALEKWPEITLLGQSYTDQGWAFVSSFLREKEEA